MSRRKQSNPKSLKWEENWNETEDGGKSAGPKSGEDEEKDTVDGSPPSVSSFRNSDSEDQGGGKNAGGGGDESGDENVSQKGVNLNKESKDESLLVKSIKSEKGVSAAGLLDEESVVKMKSCPPTSTSSTRSSSGVKGGKYRHSSKDGGGAGGEERGGNSSSPSYDHLMGPSDSSNGPPDHFSHEQLLQAGLPYLHLLPPAIRNDAARFFFMPPNVVSPELTAAAVAAMTSGTSDSSQLIQQKGKKLPPPAESPIPRPGPVYMCEPCNIKFSSSRTLEAHQTYYCSSRKEMEKDLSESKSESGDGDLKNENQQSWDSPSRGSTGGGRKRERESSGEEHELSIDESQAIVGTDGISINPVGTNQNPGPSTLNKNMKTGKLYSCSYCSYSADKKVSLNRHMRMHSGGPPSLSSSNPNGKHNGDSSSVPPPPTLGSPFPPSGGTPGRNPGEGITAADRYCFDCEIQFTSLKTFKVHKQYYCSTRHVMKAQGAPPSVKVTGSDIPSSAPSPHGSITPGLKQSCAGSPVTPEGSPIPIGSPIPSQPFVVLPTTPVIIVPYCFIQGASVIPGHLLPSQNALIILPNGSVQSLPGTSMPMPISMSFPSPPNHQLGGGGLLMGPYGHPDMSPTSTTNPTNLSPPGQHSVFNDPKDVIRRICSGTRNSSASGETVHSSSVEHPHPPHSVHRSHQSSHSEKDGESLAEMEGIEGGNEREESIPAIDLTLRHFIKKEPAEEEDEKENHDVAPHHHRRSLMGIQTPPLPPQFCPVSSQRNDAGISQSDAELRRELSANSPSRHSLGSSGSTHSGRHTPRPPSISSSCSSSPAPINVSEHHKLNGLKMGRSSGGGHNSHSGTSQGESYPNGSRQLGKGKSDHHGSGGGILGNKLRIGGGSEKMSPIHTQLPGGAILTTASNQSLAELLMSNPPELTESLAKLNSHLVMNASSSGMQPPPFDPASIMALPPDLAMTYLANIQHSIQQQQHQIQVAKQLHHQQQQQQQQPATMKRGVWKCVDCEIVFYKQENFLVHKEQYCASRSAGNNNIEGNIIGSAKDNNKNRLQRGGGGGFKSKESQILRPEVTTGSRSSSSTGETSLSPPPQHHHPRSSSSSLSGQVSSSGEMNPLSSTSSLRKSPNVAAPIERKAHVDLGSQFRPKSESPASSAAPSPAASGLGSPNPRNTPNHIIIKDEVSLPTSSISPTQYLCQKCGVKYSSLDNLTTHQTFYCNKRPAVTSLAQESASTTTELSNHHHSPAAAFSQRKTSPPPPIPTIEKLLGSSASGGGGGERGGFTRCGRCNHLIPEEQMHLHKPVCHGQSNGTTTVLSNFSSSSSSASAGWKCPCCDTYSPTMSAAQKHLETHTGIRAFKCVICGYRGNTLRGMRTHIRMHFDKRFSDLQEGDYISCITSTDLESNGQAAPSALTAGVTGSVNGALNKRRNRVTALVG